VRVSAQAVPFGCLFIDAGELIEMPDINPVNGLLIPEKPQ
jgi:hypothetical protein